jgi:hypothetical protein
MRSNVSNADVSDSPRHRALNRPLSLGALLTGDEDVALALGLLDLVRQNPQLHLELVDGILLRRPLLLKLRRQVLVLFLTKQRFFGQLVVARLHREHRFALPVLGPARPCSSHCFLSRFSSPIATATCFFASTSWVFISTRT